MGDHRLFRFLGVKPRFCKIPFIEWYTTATIVVRPVEDGYARSDLRWQNRKQRAGSPDNFGTCKASKVVLIALHKPALVSRT